MTDAELDALVKRAMDRVIERLQKLHSHAGRTAWDQVICKELSEPFATLHTQLAEANARADRAEAERAAQVEDACAVIDAHSEYDQSVCCDGRECGCQGASVHDTMKHFIRQPHDRTALDRMLTEAREKALRELAETIRGWRNDVPMTGDECANAILALIDSEQPKENMQK